VVDLHRKRLDKLNANGLVQRCLVICGALTTNARQAKAAATLLRFVASPDAAPTILKAGLMPPSAP
jgi:hypothetical protein